MAAGAGGLAAAALLLALAGPRPVPAELTDGNNEHLKREHSLMKPYQGERGAGGTLGTPRERPGLIRAPFAPSQARAPPRCRCGTSRAAPWSPASTCA